MDTKIQQGHHQNLIIDKSYQFILCIVNIQLEFFLCPMALQNKSGDASNIACAFVCWAY